MTGDAVRLTLSLVDQSGKRVVAEVTFRATLADRKWHRFAFGFEVRIPLYIVVYSFTIASNALDSYLIKPNQLLT